MVYSSSESSTSLVADASLLTCAQPLNYAGQHLIKLDPNTLNCDEIQPNGTWWTTPRIMIVIGVGLIVLFVVNIIIIIIVTRCR